MISSDSTFCKYTVIDEYCHFPKFYKTYYAKCDNTPQDQVVAAVRHM